ncbi:prenylated Rab acceptor protein 1 [Culicoides brevitarsis]|uniref:prenylated Rab acceptor protein 1 n=1 Tax=Culicoides brevitarsis TaxID=469753 RepID=UPI00307BAA2B
MTTESPSVEVSVDESLSGNMETPKEEPKPGVTSYFTRMPNLYEFLRTSRQNLRPWSQFVSTTNFKTVSNVSRLSNRMVRNVTYFASNYLCVFLGLVVYCLLTSPLILIVICGTFYLSYKIKQGAFPVPTIFGKQLNTNQQCLLVNIASVPILYLFGGGSALFWVIGASVFFISLHAAFYNIDAIVTEEAETFLDEVV